MSRKEKTYHFIYKTTDTRNGNFYIGMHSTDNLNDGYVGSGNRLRKLIYKHGKEIFNMEILEFLPDRTSLKKREEEIVNSELLKEEKCLNLRTGGDGFNSEEALIAINKSNEVQKKLISENKEWVKKRFLNFSLSRKKEYEKGIRVRQINYDWTGKHHSEDSKKKIGLLNSIKQEGKKNSQFGTHWITNGIENKKIKKEEQIPNGWKLGRNFTPSVHGNTFSHKE
jgi:hypothetical protein